jgi:hypothetical protein
MTLLAVPAVVLFLLRPDERLWSFGRERWAMLLKFGAPIAAALAAYLAYNQIRFGNPLDTGYGLLALREPQTFIDHRLSQDGTFHPSYVLHNLFYLLFQGFHAEFTGPKLTRLAGLDPLGTSLLAASPWLFALALIRFDRRVAGALAVAALVAGITLFYHSNGFSQYNAQRYALDWLPLLLLPACFARLDPTLMRVLVLWAMTLNLVTLAVLQATRVAS